MIKGTVFDIKEMTVHDGPGSRVTVFLKGCPLRCRWCHNPEGLSAKPQLMVKETMCARCGLCFKPCHHPECQPFGRCIHACPKGLVSISGKEYAPDELSAVLNKYARFLNSVGGGVTFSGGEPLMQPDFLYETLVRCPNLHKALQTSGYAEADVFEKILSAVDYVLFDIKLVDNALHKKYTGVENDKILSNYARLKASGVEYVIRVPLIPGITDTPENLAAVSEIAGEHRVELMRYNTFAPSKYKMVGMEFPLETLPSNEVNLSVFKNAVIL